MISSQCTNHNSSLLLHFICAYDVWFGNFQVFCKYKSRHRNTNFFDRISNVQFKSCNLSTVLDRLSNILLNSHYWFDTSQCVVIISFNSLFLYNVAILYVWMSFILWYSIFRNWDFIFDTSLPNFSNSVQLIVRKQIIFSFMFFLTHV